MALGQLRIPVNGRQFFTVTGGPFPECPPTFKGVKMAKEIRKPCAVDIPTVDFQTPHREVLSRGLTEALDLLLAGEPLYVGCMGGKGRTGLFLAVLAKAFGVERPVEYVRSHYYRHAVETPDQYEYVMDFPITLTQREMIKSYRRWAWVWFWRRNLTRLP
jgi:hypothetical protein